MELEPNRPVRDFVLAIPGASSVFEKSGIDYCCGGQRSLADACKTAGVAVEKIMTSLETAISSGEVPDHDFLAMTLTELINHIVGKHHVFTRDEIDRLRALMEKVLNAHGKNHRELEQLSSVLHRLSQELLQHMMKEERVLFPYVTGMEEAVKNNLPVTRPPFASVINPVRMLMFEHDKAGDLLREMRRLTSNYVTPADACISYQTLYQALDAFEKDLHQHIHLENNILFPRAVEMENDSK
ncbi:MAG TPA: iron-sulfur cluster repair di-iron protein [Pyrinomonadaceae bacterium]|nr:iron-sulfur cluster repair di-iron protein [Pyrinomonadaceae bacterium]